MSQADSDAPGERSFLREARERRGLSREDLAGSTKISLAALDALERYDVAALPGGIFTRAFVRAYAVEVGLDPEAAVREFRERCSDEEADDDLVPASESSRFFVRPPRDTVMGFRLALLAVPLAALLVFLGVRARDDASAVSAGPATEAPLPVPPPVSEPRLPAPPPVQSVGAPSPAEAPSLTLDMRPIRDCWVSATVDGEQVLSRVLRAGDREVLRAQETITINVGDAGAFVYTVNEEPGRLLGGRGQTVTETITAANYRSFLTDP